jgi:hypothetical protein
MIDPARTDMSGVIPIAQLAPIPQIAIKPVMVFETTPIQSLILPLLESITSKRFSRLKPITATNSIAKKTARDSMPKQYPGQVRQKFTLG